MPKIRDWNPLLMHRRQSFSTMITQREKSPPAKQPTEHGHIQQVLTRSAVGVGTAVYSVEVQHKTKQKMSGEVQAEIRLRGGWCHA